jgi:hypothetical protein
MFSKEFFNIMDVNRNDGISLEEVSVPHIALGLSSDTSFMKMVLRSINPSKFATENDFETENIILKEFTNLFKKDAISEKNTEALRRLALKKRKSDEQDESDVTIRELL